MQMIQISIAPFFWFLHPDFLGLINLYVIYLSNTADEVQDRCWNFKEISHLIYVSWLDVVPELEKFDCLYQPQSFSSRLSC